MNEFLVLFGYPCGSAAALLGLVLPLRYCSGRFACRVPTWSLLAHGHVQGLHAETAGAMVVSRNEKLVVLSCLAWLVVLGCSVVGEFLETLKEFDYTEKLQHTLQDMAGMGVFSLGQRSGRD